MSVDGLTAEGYRHLWQPADPEAGEGRTLVLLHGTGGTARDMAMLGRALAGAAAPDTGETGAAILSLEGDVSEQGAARFFRRRAEGIYDMDDLARATAKLDGFLARLLEREGRDPARAVGIGYSNGANLLANLLFVAPRRLGHWALMHPLIPFEPVVAPASGAQVLVTSGMRDPIAPPAETDRLVRLIEGSGASVATHRHGGGHEMARSELQALAGFVARA